MERDPVTARLAENLRTLMAAKEWTAADLTRVAQVNPTGVYDILSGKSRSPRVETVAKLAKALDVEVWELFTPADDAASRRRLLALFDRLPRDERDRLILTASAWAGTR